MKKILLAVCLMFGGATLVVAQDDRSATPGQTQTQTTQDQDQDDKQQISVSELPEAVTAKLESQDFTGWTVGNAYKKSDESNQEMFIVELRQGTETKKVKFDKDGNEIEKGGKGEYHDKADNSNYRDTETDQAAGTEMENDESIKDESVTEQPASEESATEQSTLETEHSDSEKADHSPATTEQQ